MGKGARNRARRREEGAGPREGGLTEVLLEDLFGVEDAEGLRDLVARHPGLFDGAAGAELGELAFAPAYGSMFARLLEAVEAAAEDPNAGWAILEAARRDADETGLRLEQDLQTIEAAVERRDLDTAVALVAPALAEASRVGLGLVACLLHTHRALALFQRTGATRADDLEQAIEDLEAALALTVDVTQVAELRMHLGLVYSERIRGDRAENLEHAVRFLREALASLDDTSPPDLHAIVRTNLATALLRGEGDDRVGALREAAQLCAAALHHRSSERDAVDWAYTQLNLGDILADLAHRGEVEVGEARCVYEGVIAEQGAQLDDWMVGAAHHALARVDLRAAAADGQTVMEAHASGELGSLVEDISLVETALERLRTARELTSEAPDPLRHGYVLSDLSDALGRLHADAEAIEVCREALAILRPTSAPGACADVSGRLGGLLADAGAWHEASDAFRDAIEATELLFHGRLETEAREEEMRRAGNLSRWASFAFAKAGDPVAAALVLENGRARELRQRLGFESADKARLKALPEDMHDAYAEAVASLATAPMGSAGAQAARRLQEVLAAIRAVRGYEDFATGAHAEEFGAAMEPGWPVVYVNPAPYGTLLLAVLAGSHGVDIEPRFLQDTGSMDIFMRLMAGEAAAESDAAFDRGSYLLGISGEGTGPCRFATALDDLLPWLGRAVAEPLAELLDDLDAWGVTLVLCGPIGFAPLHAATWDDGAASRCLLDTFSVSYAPSAALAAASRHRAAGAEGRPPTLVAVANPTNDLPATRPEVEAIARHFEAERTQCAFEAQADRAFLQSHAAAATHLHLACHASGAMFDPEDAVMLLADGPLRALELTAVTQSTARLVTISACQTALSSLADLADEAFSIGTAMLAAGSACSVASLWLVDDLATALLMARLYDEMFTTDCRPPDALRRAQLWLRDLTDEEEAAFLAGHPALEAEFRRRAFAGYRPGRRTPSAGAGGAHRPYAHPDLWASFVAVGT